MPRFFACRLELGSRAEGKGGGAPTGMSATAAVASKPIHTDEPTRAPSRCRANGVPHQPARESCPRRSGVRKRQPDEPVPLLNGASASRPRNEVSPITSPRALDAGCPSARRRATDGAGLHRTSQRFSFDDRHGTALPTESVPMACQRRPAATPKMLCARAGRPG